jgi:hypothetical protein
MTDLYTRSPLVDLTARPAVAPDLRVMQLDSDLLARPRAAGDLTAFIEPEEFFVLSP